MSNTLLLLLIAAAAPIAATAASAFRLPRLARRGPLRRTPLGLVALLSLVATLVVVENRSTAAEGDTHVFSGSVTDSEGAALADITVSVFCQSDCPDGSDSDPSGNPDRPWPETWRGSVQLLGEATTDASGVWSVTVTEPSSGSSALIVAWDPAGNYAFSEGRASWYGDEPVSDLSLADGGRLSGKVRGDGGALPSTRLILGGFLACDPDTGAYDDTSAYSRSCYYRQQVPEISVVVAANGDYRTPALPNGDYYLRYPHDMPEPYVAGGLFQLGAISDGMDSTADHDLLRYISVSGRVTDGAGRALSGIRVVASPIGIGSLISSPYGGAGGEAQTAADGTYSIDTVAPGTVFAVEFHSPDGKYASEYYNDHSQAADGDHLEASAESMSGIDAQLGIAGRVSGYMRDAADEPAEGGYVQLCDGRTRIGTVTSCRWGQADEAGFFEFGGLGPGLYILSGNSISRCVIVAAEGHHVRVNLDEAVDQAQFVDVPEDAYYSTPVMTLAEQGVFARTEWGDGLCPDAPIDRKTMAVWTVRVLDGEDPPELAPEESRFHDVWRWFYAPFIERMAELEITGGCGDGSGFCPDDAVTRAQMAVFLSRAYDLPAGPDPGFGDVDSNAWYAADVARLAASGITAGCGDGTRFCPGQDTTRAQMATFLYRAANPAN